MADMAAILDIRMERFLHVTPMPPTKLGSIWLKGSGADVVSRLDSQMEQFKQF